MCSRKRGDLVLKKAFVACLAAVWMATAAWAAPHAGDVRHADVKSFAGWMISTPPKAMHLDPFYAKYASADGIPVISSAKVSDKAILIARDIVSYMLSERPDIRHAMIKNHARVGIMAITESTMDIPEQRDWKKPAKDDPRLTFCERKNYDATIGKMTDYQYWAERARGMGGTYTTGAEENILGVPGTRYYGENILVHEFSHNIFDTIREMDPKLAAAVYVAYRHAKEEGLWRGAYMENTVDEYWAEGTQFWFNSNMAYKRDGLSVATDADFQQNDPDLYAILATVYPASHHIPADVFYMSPARLKARPVSTAPDHGC